MLESEKTNLTDKIFNLEKEKMQWNLEKQIMNNNKMELEEKQNQLFNRINSQQKELEQLKKPPVNIKLKENTKTVIKDIMTKNIVSSAVSKNILQSAKGNINIPLSLRKCNSNGQLSNNYDSNTDRCDESVSNYDDSEQNPKVNSNSKRISSLGKSPLNKFKLNLFSDNDVKENME